jgi:hypothetical protein
LHYEISFVIGSNLVRRPGRLLDGARYKKRERVFYGSSSKSAERYTECVAQAWTGLGAPFKKNVTHNGYDLVLSNSVGGVSAVLATTEWRGKVETTLTAQKSGLDSALVQAANLCL